MTCTDGVLGTRRVDGPSPYLIAIGSPSTGVGSYPVSRGTCAGFTRPAAAGDMYGFIPPRRASVFDPGVRLTNLDAGPHRSSCEPVAEPSCTHRGRPTPHPAPANRNLVGG
jgi:hypothetical protein